MSSDSGESAGPLTGWEASAPPEDTILRQFILAQTAFQRLSGEAMGATVVETDRFIAVDTGRPATMLNFAVLRQPLLGPELGPAMEELEAVFGAPDARGFAALYSPLSTPDLSPWGWTLSGHPPLQLRSPLTAPLDTSNVRVERVATGEDLAIFEQIMVEGFGMEEMCGAAAGSLFGPRLLDDARFSVWLGYVDGNAVSGAASMVEAGIVDIVMVATLPEARRKGAGLATTQAASRLELGLPAVLFSSDDGRPVYEKLGFVPILRGAFWYRNR